MKKRRKRGKTLVLTPGEAALLRGWYLNLTNTGAFLPYPRAAWILAVRIRKTALGKRLGACVRRRYVPRAIIRALAGVARPARGHRAGLPRAERARQMTVWEERK